MALHRLQAGFGQVAADLEDLIKAPICVSCGQCCQANTPQMMAIEAMNAVSVLAGNGKLIEALARAEHWLTTRHAIAPSYEGQYAGCYLPPKIKDEHVALVSSPCPMLTDDKQCFIHEVRPMACRAFNVTWTPGFPACSRPPGKNEQHSARLYLKCPELKDHIAKFKEFCREVEPRFILYGFVPTMIYRAGREVDFYRLVQDNRIASAKIVGDDIDKDILWQEQHDALKRGVMPDIVAAMK